MFKQKTGNKYKITKFLKEEFIKAIKTINENEYCQFERNHCKQTKVLPVRERSVCQDGYSVLNIYKKKLFL